MYPMFVAIRFIFANLIWKMYENDILTPLAILRLRRLEIQFKADDGTKI